MANTLMRIPSLEEYAKVKKIKFDYNNLNIRENLSCEECRYCRMGVNACVYGNQVRNLDYMTSCPRVNRFAMN